MIPMFKQGANMDRSVKGYSSMSRLCLMLLALLLFQNVYGFTDPQRELSSGDTSQTITLAFNGVKLSKVLSVLQERTSMRIIYSKEDVTSYQDVSVHCNTVDLDQVMSEVLDNTTLDYELTSNQVLIFQKNKNPQITNSVVSQDNKKIIKGTVVDEKGMPIPGATVSVPNSDRGVITDPNGNYSLNVADAKQLLFSFIGYKPQTIAINGRSTIRITLIEDLKNLDEVVIVAYGVQKKSDLTGAVSSVKSEDMEKVAVSTPAESLQGRVSGVTVSRSSGAPGASMKVRVRGVASFGGNTPLYIIDGVEGDINTVNPDDVASMEVLKDASSAAIYGSRAANGVVIITTKQGDVGKLRVNFSAYAGPQSVAKRLPLMTNTADWMKVNGAAFDNTIQNAKDYNANKPKDAKPIPVPTPGAWLSDKALLNTNTDWQDEMYRAGMMQNYNVNFNGGTKDVKYLFSMGYFDQEGIVVGTDYNKISARMKMDMTIGMLKITPNISITQDNYNNMTTSIGRINKITPFAPVYDSSKPSGYGYSDYTTATESNPYGEQMLNESKSKYTDINTNLMLSLEPVKNLFVKLNTGYRNNFYTGRTHNPSYQINPKDKVSFPVNSESSTYFNQYLVEPTVSYHLDFDKHSVDLLGGMSAQSQYYRNHGVSVEGKDPKGNPAGFPDQDFNTINAGKGGTFSGSGTEYTFNRSSIFGRFNYSYDSKYLFQATIRRDGTSKFSDDYRYGVFPSFSAGWNVHRESFWEPIGQLVSRLKLRASWGKLGSDENLSNYFYQGLMKAGYAYELGGVLNQGAYPAGMYISDYRWEESVDTNFGADFGLFENSLFGSVNYFTSTRKDILVSQPLPISSGMSSQMMNIGEMKNYGWELELGYRSSGDHDFTWDATATFSTIKNEVISLGDGVKKQEGSNIEYKMPVVWTEVGGSVGSLYTYKTDGLFQNEAEVIAHSKEGNLIQPNAKPGDVRFVDVNDDGVINSNDVTSTGSALPDFEFGLSLNMAYKGFDLNIFMNGRKGNKIFNRAKYLGESMVGNFNYWDTTLDFWTPENTDTDMPRPVQDDTKNSRMSDRFIEDGSYLRLKSLQLGYSFSNSVLESLHMEKLRVYLSGQNLFTITDYSGYDPAVDNSKIWNMGVDYGSYPSSRTYLMGVQISF
ncbi:TonB-dependent receptor [Halosquirtibacter laminarini]|uniref:TonB-dependent receptor n=1 Tax=Halosquirtibacter laminarini TaxID=3374600 RepID=A0AC61NHR8_9BACT|nr:TonB-dependent receptor [Prolixibacteraceae bacterium]